MSDTGLAQQRQQRATGSHASLRPRCRPRLSPRARRNRRGTTRTCHPRGGCDGLRARLPIYENRDRGVRHCDAVTLADYTKGVSCPSGLSRAPRGRSREGFMSRFREGSRVVGGVLLGGTLLLSLSVLTNAQATRTVQDGVFTDAQAARGQGVYRQQCASCHGNSLEGAQAPPLVADGFVSRWQSQPLSRPGEQDPQHDARR